MPEKDSSFQRMFDSAWFTRVSRSLMIVASLIGLPVAGWYMTRLITKADTVIETVTKIDRRQDIMEQYVKLKSEQRDEQVKAIREILTDHEGRIRWFERAGVDQTGPRRAPN